MKSVKEHHAVKSVILYYQDRKKRRRLSMLSPKACYVIGKLTEMHFEEDKPDTARVASLLASVKPEEVEIVLDLYAGILHGASARIAREIHKSNARY